MTITIGFKAIYQALKKKNLGICMRLGCWQFYRRSDMSVASQYKFPQSIEML